MNEIFKCPICGKEFNSRRSLGSHLGYHVKLGEYLKKPESESLNKPFLHKIDESLGKIIEYVCKCGRSFINFHSYRSHCGHCEVRTGRKDKGRGSNIQDWWNKLKLDNPDEFYELHSKAGKASIESNILKYGENPLTIFSRTPSKARENAHKKQSKTRKRKYLNGELTPANGIGKGYGSYFNGRYLRSTYELIYVLYLYVNNIEYEYESVRVKYNDKIFISDFKIGDKIIEVKGKIEDIPKVKLAFESNGYNIEFITPNDIFKLKDELRKLIPIDELLTKLIESLRSSKSNRFIWNIDENRNILYSVVHKNDLNINNLIYHNIIKAV